MSNTELFFDMKKILTVLACITVPALPAHAGQKIGDNIELSGLVEVEASYSEADGDDSSDIVLAELELGIDAEITDWFSAHILFLYEEDETDGIEVDKAFASITPGGSEHRIVSLVNDHRTADA